MILQIQLTQMLYIPSVRFPSYMGVRY